MKKTKTAALIAALITAVSVCGCSNDKDGSKAQSSSVSSEKTESVEQVTLPPAESAPEDSADDTSSVSDGEEKQEVTPAMWQATAPDGDTMYMIGSMHALKEECYPLPDYIMDAYEQADILAVECDIADISATFSAGVKQMNNMYYDDGTTLIDHISEETYNNLDSYLEKHGEDISLYDQMKPWFVSSMVESYAVADAGLDSTKGLDMSLLQMAHEEEKEIYQVESLDFQMDLLMNFSDEIYDLMLSEYSADNIDEINTAYEGSYEAWKTGDTDALEEADDTSEMTEEQKKIFNEYNQQLLYDRNVGMAEKVKELFERDENTLFVVGAAHFVGEGGIIDLLEDEGYSFELVSAQ